MVQHLPLPTPGQDCLLLLLLLLLVVVVVVVVVVGHSQRALALEPPV